MSLPSRTVYAVISLMGGPTSPLQPRVGTVIKHGKPLMTQDQPWEPRIDNGYPNVLAPGLHSTSWQLFYGDCVDGCEKQLLLYANSTDGLEWKKPNLGLFDISAVRPDLAPIGRANNVVLQGGGIGVWRDEESGRYVAFGPGCYAESYRCLDRSAGRIHAERMRC